MQEQSAMCESIKDVYVKVEATRISNTDTFIYRTRKPRMYKIFSYNNSAADTF